MDDVNKWPAMLAFNLLGGFCLTPWATPGLALAAGGVVALGLGNPFGARTGSAAKFLLQACIVILGVSMNLPMVLHVGAGGVVLAAVTIIGTLALGLASGRWLGVERLTSTLISAGTAICGGSAIAAVGSALDAGEAQMTVALGTVFVLNAVALYLFPPIGHALHLSAGQFGIWAGIAIHDVSSVVGAASRYGGGALPIATAVKLSRALWIVPVVLAMATVAHRNTPDGDRKIWRRVRVPWFIGLFVLASVLRSVIPAVAAHAAEATHVATAGLTLALFLIGAGLSRKTLAAIGWKPMAQGMFLWVAVSAASLWAVTHWVH